LQFLLGWRLRHQAKIVTSFLLIPAVGGSGYLLMIS
jgi:hypothetical protein